MTARSQPFPCELQHQGLLSGPHPRPSRDVHGVAVSRCPAPPSTLARGGLHARTPVPAQAGGPTKSIKGSSQAGGAGDTHLIPSRTCVGPSQWQAVHEKQLGVTACVPLT